MAAFLVVEIALVLEMTGYLMEMLSSGRWMEE